MNKERRKWGFNPIGEKYGKLTVISEAPKRIQPSGQKPRRFICKCDCGKETDVLGLHLVRGRIESCGCICKTKNGESATRLHRKWKSMIERCYPNSINSKNYYEKGIRVCDEWHNNYLAFKKWALENGYKRKLTIDRIDNSKGYYTENCRFITGIENINNRDITLFVIYKGERVAFMPLMRRLNITDETRLGTIRARIKRGHCGDYAIDTPTRKGNYKGFERKKPKP